MQKQSVNNYQPNANSCLQFLLLLFFFTSLFTTSGWGGESRALMVCRMSCVRLVRYTMGLATTVFTLAVQAMSRGMEACGQLGATADWMESSWGEPMRNKHIKVQSSNTAHSITLSFKLWLCFHFRHCWGRPKIKPLALSYSCVLDDLMLRPCFNCV